MTVSPVPQQVAANCTKSCWRKSNTQTQGRCWCSVLCWSKVVSRQAITIGKKYLGIWMLWREIPGDMNNSCNPKAAEHISGFGRRWRKGTTCWASLVKARSISITWICDAVDVNSFWVFGASFIPYKFPHKSSKANLIPASVLTCKWTHRYRMPDKLNV